MNCEVLNRNSITSLYLNGRLINEEIIEFKINECTFIDFKITKECCFRRGSVISLHLHNSLNEALNEIFIRVFITPINCINCEFYNSRCITCRINCLCPNESSTTYLRLPVCCCMNNKVTAQLNVGNCILKEESIII